VRINSAKPSFQLIASICIAVFHEYRVEAIPF